MGATMVSLSDAVKASDAATLLTGFNDGLRTAMDLMVRDLLQVGQGLPAGRVIVWRAARTRCRCGCPARPHWSRRGYSARRSVVLSSGPTYVHAGNVVEQITAVIPGPNRGPVINGRPTDMITTLAVDSSFDGVRLTAFAANGQSMTVGQHRGQRGGRRTSTSPTEGQTTSMPAT